jgi:hypothetical protein
MRSGSWSSYRVDPWDAERAEANRNRDRWPDFGWEGAAYDNEAGVRTVDPDQQRVVAYLLAMRRTLDEMIAERKRNEYEKRLRSESVSEFVVTEQRLKRAKDALRECGRDLDLQQQLDIVEEARWSDQAELHQGGGRLNFTLTDLQIVMLAAAFAAVREAGGSMKEGDGWQGQESLIPF